MGKPIACPRCGHDMDCDVHAISALWGTFGGIARCPECGKTVRTKEIEYGTGERMFEKIPRPWFGWKLDLEQMLDRIDAEHESKVGCTADEWDYWESTHVELPKDADGEYIHAGDVLDGYGKTIEVVELRHGRSGWVLISRDGNGYADTFAFTHHHAPTVEDVLTEMFAKAIERGELTNGAAQTIAEYASKLQLREDA